MNLIHKMERISLFHIIFAQLAFKKINSCPQRTFSILTGHRNKIRNYKHIFKNSNISIKDFNRIVGHVNFDAIYS